MTINADTPGGDLAWPTSPPEASEEISPSQLPAEIGIILKLAYDRLISQGTGRFVSENNTIISQNEVYFPKNGKYFVQLSYDGETANIASFYGGGRETSLETMRLRLRLHLRSMVDKTDEDYYNLTSQDIEKSITALSHIIKNALHGYFPEDDLGNSYALSPFYFINSGIPQRNSAAREWSIFDLYYGIDVAYNYGECNY